MTMEEVYDVAFFMSVSHAMKAEKILKNEDIPYKLIPVPKNISTDCGICLRFRSELKERILAALDGKVEIAGIRSLE